MVERLDVLTELDIRGFDNENDMVENLTAVVANRSTCFAPGAGNLIVNG